MFQFDLVDNSPAYVNLKYIEAVYLNAGDKWVVTTRSGIEFDITEDTARKILEAKKRYDQA